MPIIRNPFRRNEEAARAGTEKPTNEAAPKSIEIKEPTEYKLSGKFAQAVPQVTCAVEECSTNQKPQRSTTVESIFQYAPIPNIARRAETDPNVAVTHRAQDVLVNQVKQLHQLVQPPQRAQRERALQHLARVVRLLQEIICTSELSRALRVLSDPSRTSPPAPRSSKANHVLAPRLTPASSLRRVNRIPSTARYRLLLKTLKMSA